MVSIDCCRECSSHHVAHIEHEKRGSVDRTDQLPDGRALGNYRGHAAFAASQRPHVRVVGISETGTQKPPVPSTSFAGQFPIDLSFPLRYTTLQSLREVLQISVNTQGSRSELRLGSDHARTLKSFAMRSYKKCVCKSPEICTCESLDLMCRGMNTYEKRRGGPLNSLFICCSPRQCSSVCICGFSWPSVDFFARVASNR